MRALAPEFSAGRYVRLGYDSEGLGAVSVVQELDGPAEVEWEFGAVALRLRGKGGGYADEMCRDVFDQLTARAIEAGISNVKIIGYVYEENHASQKMNRRHGMRHVSNGGPGVQVWQRNLPV
ncbi:hypothetical protein [Blastococcus sp. VKM Ac-2987]|uniref:hypothetical protein n=1 Tax=Blastococcus sp. VKM Ac-2987 TaxID=3004141 RepID=UPI0022ABAEF8|nr:hypothetical protein [Blastococcus sp. VKM Ac-2987]MCZ2857827.1 hypothetical protein [Blastococcus sp. VKM Ac-2987]